jgi:hypothetical protein
LRRWRGRRLLKDQQKNRNRQTLGEHGATLTQGQRGVRDDEWGRLSS